MYCRLRSSYKEGRIRIPLTGLTPSHFFFVCPNPEPTFPTSYVVVSLYFVLSEMCVRFVDIGGIADYYCLEVIVYFVDIGEIVDHHCLEAIVGFVDIGKVVDHHCLAVIVCCVVIGGIVDHHCLEVIICCVNIGGLLTITV